MNAAVRHFPTPESDPPPTLGEPAALPAVGQRTERQRYTRAYSNWRRAAARLDDETTDDWLVDGHADAEEEAAAEFLAGARP